MGRLRKTYCSLQKQIDKFCKDNQTFSLIRIACDRTRIYFKDGFFGRITELSQEDNAATLENSKFIRYVLSIYKKVRYKCIIYAQTSMVFSSSKALKKGLYLRPVKTGSSIVVIAILTNILFSIILNKEMGLLAWTIKAVFLFIGLGGLFSNASWQDLKQTSLSLRYLCCYNKK